MKKGRRSLVAMLVGSALVLAVTGSTFAADPQPPQTLEQMYEWCHGSAGNAHMSPAATTEVAKLLGLSATDLITERNSGKSIFQMASAKGITEQSVLDAALAPYRDNLALRVKYGHITQQQADLALNDEQGRLRTTFNASDVNAYGFNGQGMMGGIGGMMRGFGGMMGGGFGGMMGGYNKSNSNGPSGGYDGRGMMGRAF